MEHNESNLLQSTGLSDWEKIYSLNGIYEENCWKSGCNSHCCNYNIVSKNFKIIKKVNEIPLFPGEYYFLKQNNKFQQYSTIKILSFSLKNNIKIPIILNWCPLNGKCSNHNYRPVMCRLYPYFPKIDYQCRVLGLERSIPYDLFWEEFGEKMPCSITSLSIDSINSTLEIVNNLCKDPINIFYMMMASIYKKNINTQMKKYILQLNINNSNDFFKLWEKLMILNKLFNVKETINEITELWNLLNF